MSQNTYVLSTLNIGSGGAKFEIFCSGVLRDTLLFFEEDGVGIFPKTCSCIAKTAENKIMQGELRERIDPSAFNYPGPVFHF